MDLLKQKIEEIFEKDSSGHDAWHIKRVVFNAKEIQKLEGGDSEIIEMAAWCHDLGDHKLGHPYNADEYIAIVLGILNVTSEKIKRVQEIVAGVSFKGAEVSTLSDCLEGKIVQDADRLDAIGAIGIARCFSYSGHKGTKMHSPNEGSVIHKDFENYKNSKGSAINHFHEKLLLLKNLMQTETGKEMAEKRHDFMLQFLNQFDTEWRTD